MMEPLIFDTSVWIAFLNNKNTNGAALLEEYILDDGEVLLTPTILQEILQGIKEDAVYKKIKETLAYFTVLELPQVEAATGAADLYRMLRKRELQFAKAMTALLLITLSSIPLLWFIMMLILI
ncbi:type II toxin-antitoxin system VapC family toxin [Niabella ginsengisoli]|uniref:PIN domain-containing protein n=1 Tax=Niabella ginsengisoli TaxID=522298 RepID=A0ABS9SPS6_9BACT|nr:PIN domain-containing protein [Niabella ginsengisoli]MCH5600369.1 PIN domain-containing protein [Niabella ginsengisoli]